MANKIFIIVLLHIIVYAFLAFAYKVEEGQKRSISKPIEVLNPVNSKKLTKHEMGLRNLFYVVFGVLEGIVVYAILKDL